MHTRLKIMILAKTSQKTNNYSNLTWRNLGARSKGALTFMIKLIIFFFNNNLKSWLSSSWLSSSSQYYYNVFITLSAQVFLEEITSCYNNLVR